MNEDERDTSVDSGNPDTGDDNASATDDAADLKAEVERWKAHSRKQEERAKANAAAAQRLAEIEESQKSETHRLQEAKAKAEQEASQHRRELALMKVGIRKGLTEDQLEWLQGKGDTEEELEAAADKLLAMLKPRDEGDQNEIPRRPRETLRNGTGPVTEPEETDPRKLAAGLPRY